jgi:hypothetical protein
MKRKPLPRHAPLNLKERERLEDERDLALARKARNEKSPSIPWEQIKKELGL